MIMHAFFYIYAILNKPFKNLKYSQLCDLEAMSIDCRGVEAIKGNTYAIDQTCNPDNS